MARQEGVSRPLYGSSPHVASFVQTTITVVIVGLFWATGQDPNLDLYVLMAILGTFAILVVQTLCSFAVIGYFACKHPEARTGSGPSWRR
jgi:amino acid transporter